jgi:glycosyltransferase involved in cell wall biosynthesis
MLRVFIAHPGKQYTQGLINACMKSDIYLMLFTLIAIDPKKLTFLPAKLQKLLSKRKFEGIASKNITQYPWLLPLFKWWGGKAGISLFPYRIFDLLVAHAIRRKDYDLIIAYENCNLFTQRQAKKMGKITVLDLAQIHHEDILDCMRLFGTAEQISYEEYQVNPQKTQALNFTDYIFCLSDYARQSLIRHGIATQKIFKLNLGLDLVRFADKQSYNQNSTLQLLFVGTVMKRKGIEVLLQVFDKLKDYEINLTIIGPPGDAMSLLTPQNTRYTYLPFLPHEELAEAYRSADIFIFPSYLDSWAQTVIEAMACGTPVIVSDNTGAKEAVVQGGGFVVPTGDVDAYVEKILYFYHNREAIESMGRQARKVAEQYTWDNYHQQVQAALKEIAKRENIAW